MNDLAQSSNYSKFLAVENRFLIPLIVRKFINYQNQSHEDEI